MKILGEWDVLSTLKRITSAQVKIVYNLNIKGKVINLHLNVILACIFFLIQFSRVYVMHQESLMEH